MNEQLQKMAEQAGVIFDEFDDDPTYTYGATPNVLERFAAYVIAAEQEEREWCGNAETPVKCFADANGLCRGCSCKNFSYFIYNKHRALVMELNKIKTSKDLCGND